MEFLEAYDSDKFVLSRHIEINSMFTPFKTDYLKKVKKRNRPEYSLSNSLYPGKQGLTPGKQSSRKQYLNQGLLRRKSHTPHIHPPQY